MKKKKWLIPVSIVGGILIVLGSALGIFFAKGYRVSVGAYVELKNGNPFLTYDTTSIRLDNETNRKLFKDLTIGDQILVIHDGVGEGLSPFGIHVYSTNACAVFKLRDGTIEDAPQAVVEHYIEFGWLEKEPPSKTPAEEAYYVAQYYAPYSEDALKAIYARACNKEEKSITDVANPREYGHLPILKFDTLAEFEQFKNAVGDPLASPSHLQDGYVEYGEDFFAENTLMIVYVKAPSSGISYSMVSVESENGRFCIHMKDLAEAGKVYTDDSASWYYTAEIPDSMLKNCTEFDADLNYTENESMNCKTQ